MTARIPFFKYSATGNDFILLDHRRKIFRGDETMLFEKLCARKTGIGADGMLLIEAPRLACCDFTMRYFNRDGRESEMCGNGARASAYHAASTQLAPNAMRFEVSGEVYQAWVDNAEVRLLMQTPRDLRLRPGVVSSFNKKEESKNLIPNNSPLKGGIALEQLEEGGFVNTGVPHYVLFVANVDQVDVETIGRELRHHPAFAPAGTNVNFVERLAPSHVKLRTYERGVEEETLACGTGATATALLTHLIHGDAFPIRLQTCGGELLVSRDAATERFVLQGHVERVFTGEFELCK
ncbi:MAG: diaminopimelate epimerase [candidate division KSB1 bacterium]